MTLTHFHDSNDQTGSGDIWVATVVSLQARIPALGSIATINRYLVAQDGIPHRRLGRRLIFNINEVNAWLNRQAS